MASKTRFLKRVVYLLCEGGTEKHYFDRYRSSNRLSFTIKPVDVSGGGYAKMKKEVIRSSGDGAIARVVLIDFDRYYKHSGEVEAFEELLKEISSQNKRGLPVFLVVSNPDFDDFVLLHDPNYHLQNKSKFLSSIGYKTEGDFKADENVYDAFNGPHSRCLENALSRLNPNAPFSNKFKFTKSTFTVKNEVTKNPNLFTVRTSNIKDLFALIEQLGE